MRVCHVITGLRVGGAELALARHVERAHRHGIMADVVSLETPGAVAERLRERGTKVTSLELDSRRPSPSALLRLARHLDVARADVVQGWMYHANIFAGAAARLAGRPVAWGIHQTSLAKDVTTWQTRAIARSGGPAARVLADRVVYCAHAAAFAHEARGYPRSKRVVIHNGWDIVVAQPTSKKSMRRELGVPENVELLGHVARFDPYKNHRGLVRAIALAQRSHARFHAVLVGRGVDGAAAELAAAAPELDWDRVHLLGERHDAALIMKAFDVLVSSSTSEALPSVVGEAMAAGVPAIVTDVGDSALLVGDTGPVVPPEDDAALASAIVEMLHTPAADRERMGASAQERIQRDFSLDRSTELYALLHRGLLAGRVE